MHWTHGGRRFFLDRSSRHAPVTPAVVQEVIEAARIPVSFDLGTKLMIWLDAINPYVPVEQQADDAYERAKEYFQVK